MHSLPTEPDTGSSSQTDRFDSQNAMDKKYNEVKGLNQKLMDYIKEQEKKNKQQYQTIKGKLDDSKTHVRRLEDENITLKFELTASQEREKQLHKQLSEMKVLLKKYYNKAQSSEVSSDKDSISSSPMIEPLCKPKLNRHHTTNLVIDTNKRQNGPAEDVTFEITSPRTAQPDMIHTNKEENSALLVMKEKGGSAGVSLENQKDKERKSLFSRKRDIQEITEKDSIDEKMHANSELSLYDTAASREADQKLHLDLTKCSLENRDHSQSNDKIHTVTHFPTHGNEYSPATADPLSKRKAQTLVLDVSGVPRQVENLLEENCIREYSNGKFMFLIDLRRFNMLSQNIVALDVRPEISNDTLSAMKNPQSIGDLDGALTRKSVLKYVPKTPGTRGQAGQAFFPDQLSFPKPVHDIPLFQDFIVIGVDKEDLSSFAKNNPKQSRGSLKPKILYSYPTPPSGMNEPPRSSIPEFAFPFGVSVRKLRSTPSFSDLNSIIFKTNDYQLKSKCFIFPLLSEDPTIDPPNLGEVIEKSNPNHLLYNVCIYFKDFVNMTDKSTKPKSSKDFRYFKTYKLMCFVTQYPFINFFFETITTLFRLLKIERELELSKANPQDLLRYENLGETFTSAYFKEVVEKNLKKMLETPIPQFSKPLNIELQGNLMELPVQYQIEDASKGWILESIWACIPVFNYISLKDLLWIFSAFILERKLVFLSKNIHLLTATMSVIRSLIKPFRYPFPLVYNLPEVLMAICDAPGAAIIGINKGESYLEEENLLTDYPSCIFICLDEEKIHVDKTANKLDIPQLGNIEKSLLTHYAKFNADLNYNIVDFSKNKGKVANKKTLKFAGNAEIREKCVKVLEIFKTTLEEKILKLIPVKPIVKLDKELDYAAISAAMLEKAGESEKAFLKQFVETQIFIYHLEKHFEKR